MCVSQLKKNVNITQPLIPSSQLTIHLPSDRPYTYPPNPPYTYPNVDLYTSEDVVMHNAFPTTFKGPTLKWFTSLPPHSIDCFDSLSNLFATLRTFIDRFSKAALRVKNLTQDVILQCMALALKPRPFAYNVSLRPPATMHELKLHEMDYIQMEEMKTL